MLHIKASSTYVFVVLHVIIQALRQFGRVVFFLMILDELYLLLCEHIVDCVACVIGVKHKRVAQTSGEETYLEGNPIV